MHKFFQLYIWHFVKKISPYRQFMEVLEVLSQIGFSYVLTSLLLKEIYDLFTMHCIYDFFAWLICMICTKMF